MIIERVEFWIGLLVPIVINGVILKIYDATRIAKLKKIAELQSDTVVSLVKQAANIAAKINNEIFDYLKGFKDSLRNNLLEEYGPTITNHFFNVYKDISDCVDRFVRQAENSNYAISKCKEKRLKNFLSSMQEDNNTMCSILDYAERTLLRDINNTLTDDSLSKEDFNSVRGKYRSIKKKLYKIQRLLCSLF